MAAAVTSGAPVDALDFDDVPDTHDSPRMTFRHAARVCGVDESSVRRWCRLRSVGAEEYVRRREDG
jgi:hypothetical protein